MRGIVSIFFLLVLQAGFAQISGLKQVYLDVKQGECYKIDTALVDPVSVQIVDADTSLYSFVEGQLCWKGESTDSALVQYRVISFQSLIRHKNPNDIKVVAYDNPFAYTPNAKGSGVNYGQLNTAGNISRGVGFGNAQDIVVNSNLNLRINGKLPGDVEVIAVISDENNPIQPEGNTQQIQDFDQVYITFKRDSSSITVGDFLMQTEEPLYFMKYYKKSRGAQVQSLNAMGDWRIDNGAEVAISRGRFSRNQIEGIEGNSGPYRLSGVNGEQFIIIIAGTEVVYLDGKRLTRGEDYDYVINYNTGEITFTPSVVITRYSRIVVEFQYSDRNYARTVMHAGSGVSNGTWNFYALHYFNEMDLKNQPFQANLDSSLAVDLIRTAGDNPAFMENITAYNNYNADRIMYRKVDSMGTTIYVYSDQPESDSVFYEVRFSNVGFGQGSYVQVQSAANGKVFEYRGPGMGDYEPVQVLIAPRSMNMFVFGAVRQSSNQRSGIEFSYSLNDQNTRSAIDDGDNQGFGIKLYQETHKALKDSSDWQLNTGFSYEMVSKNFQYIERYRNVEFDRSWNKTLNNPLTLNSVTPAFENIILGNVRIEGKDHNHYGIEVSSFIRPNSFEGYSGALSFRDNYLPWLTLYGDGNYLQSLSSINQAALQNVFAAGRFGFELPFQPFTVGSEYSRERSNFIDPETDSLGAMGYGYEQFRSFLQSRSSSKLDYRLDYEQRLDELPGATEFASSTMGRNYRLQVNYPGKGSNRVAFNLTYRTLDILDTALSDKTRENTLQSRIEFDYSMLKKVLRTRTFFQVGTGQEQRREFQYLQVQPGNGVYIWNDYDSNGIRTLNEFEIASDLDRIRADYIRIFVPVPGFFTTNTNKFSETFEIRPSAFFTQKEGWRSVVARFYSLSTLILENKILPSGVLALINPINNQIGDSALINRSESFRTTLFFNRRSPVFGADYTFLQNGSKILLTNGFDSRSWKEHELNMRINIRKSFTFRAEIQQGTKAYSK